MTERLLIHSLGEFSCITLPALERSGARIICEIGAEHGGNSAVLATWLRDAGGSLTSIDPSVSPDYLQWLGDNRDICTHVPLPSLEAIRKVGPHDAWFIDGDHNWFTVFNELSQIRQVQLAHARPLLAFLHDVDWPCARRDHYYAPDRIPAEFLHPHSWKHGSTMQHGAVAGRGFRGEGAFAIALEEGGPRNGVMTAVEDFTAEHPGEYFWAHIPGVFGLGVLFSQDHPASQALAELLAPLHDHPLLATLERNRLANYLRVIELQDENAARVQQAL